MRYEKFSYYERIWLSTIFDATYSVQSPGGNGKTSGGDVNAPYLAKAAVAVGVNGLLLKHILNPLAKSDGANMIPFSKMDKLIQTIKIDAIN